MKTTALDAPPCGLGEGPLWDAESETLYWVDSLAPRLYRHDTRNDSTASFDLPGKTVGSLAVRAGGGLVLAMDQGFYLFDPDSGSCRVIALPLEGRVALRFNDGKVDPFGDFVAGAMNIDPLGEEDGAMYRLGADLAVSRVLDGFHCFNGPCFSADGRHLYVTGRDDGVIEVFDYGPGQAPRNPGRLLSGCNPDGATVDAEGYVWSAQWDDACLLRIAPDGVIDARLEIPGQVVSSLMFGGAGLDRIFVTTLGQSYYGAEPRSSAAGKILVIDDSGYRGRPEPRFKG
jgi:L-arabinonolactonase